jgi:thymidylate synthase ThyX
MYSEGDLAVIRRMAALVASGLSAASAAAAVHEEATTTSILPATVPAVAPGVLALVDAAQTYEKLADWNPHIAGYVVPNGFNRRVLFTMNLREAFAFCQLRAAANAHFSIRRVARRVAEEIQRVHPLLAKYMRLPEGETWQGIEEQFL